MKRQQADTHSCIAPLYCGDQSITGRKLVVNRIFWQFSSPISHQVTLPCSTAPPHVKKLQQLAFTCAGCTHQQDIKRGRDCYTIDNIKQPIHEKQLKFCYFWKLAGSHRSHGLKGGATFRARLAALQGGVRVKRGDRGAGLQWGGRYCGGCLTLLSPRWKLVMIEPRWKEASV